MGDIHVLSAAAGWAATGVLGTLHLRARRRLVLVARASHELRGPLFAARLGLHGLARAGEAGRVAAIDLELRRAGLALEDLAAAPAGGRAESRPEAVDMAALVRAYAPAWRTLAAAHDAGLAVEAPPTPLPVQGDALRLAQACANLVGNAAEHGGGIVRLRVRRAAERVRIEVADRGPGLPAPVGELTAAARGRRGRRGHGLAIAAAIAEHHGGRLAAAPAAVGARLVLDLPAADASPTPPPGRLRARRHPDPAAA